MFPVLNFHTDFKHSQHCGILSNGNQLLYHLLECFSFHFQEFLTAVYIREEAVHPDSVNVFLP